VRGESWQIDFLSFLSKIVETLLDTEGTNNMRFKVQVRRTINQSNKTPNYLSLTMSQCNPSKTHQYLLSAESCNHLWTLKEGRPDVWKVI